MNTILQLVPAVIGIVLAGFWLWMIVNLANNEYIPRETKNYYFIGFIFLNVFAALWYYLAEYRPRHL